MTSRVRPPEPEREPPVARGRRRALVVEDEPDVAALIEHHLGREGYDVAIVDNGADAVRLAHERPHDLVILDLMIPRLNGWEVCRRLRQDPETAGIPIIMVTGRAEEGDKILGFELGADDYLTKPFSPRELVARVRAVARRVRQDADARRHISVGHLEIDRDRFEVRMKGRAVDLTRKEFELLAVLAASPGRVFGREELLDLVWGREQYVEPRTVDVHFARLRAKFTAAKLPAPPVEAVRGVGYRYREAGP
ncbi:MAG: response regulator transcription factor [Candidatus Rokubacteria bacterium]|nr:response regulator transcription factor [Candidatus Rokubacteria bacterium]